MKFKLPFGKNSSSKSSARPMPSSTAPSASLFAPSTKRPRFRLFGGATLTIKSKLMLVLILLCVASMLTFGIKSYLDFRQTITKRLMSKLTTSRNTKQHYIKFYFENIRQQVSVLSQDRAFIDAMNGFRDAYHVLDSLPVAPEAALNVRRYYEQEFIPRIANGESGEKRNFMLDVFLPKKPSAVYLQNQYIALNPNPVGKKIQLMKASDSSAYSTVHAKYHGMFREFVEKFNYYDMFLIDAETGEVVYSAFKETDFTTNLRRGPNAASSLAKLFENVVQSKEKGYVKIMDFLPYEPSYGTAAAFIGAPIFDETKGTIIGVLAFQISVDEITKIMTSSRDWKSDGMGKTGETYLVGADFLMRSQSRFLLEDPKGYAEMLKKTNMPSNIVEKIQKLETSILLQEVRTEAAITAQSGRSDTRIIRDYRNEEVLSSFAPLQIPDLQWVILSEMDMSEAFEPVREYEQSLLVWTAASIVVATLIALLVANTLTKPISALTYNAQRIGEGEMFNLKKVRSGDEFEKLSQAFEMMVQSLQAQKELVEMQNKDFERLLFGVFPEAVAHRLERNERYFVETVPAVSIVVTDVVGFSKVMQTIGSEKGVDILNDLLVAFDETAARHGIERIKTIGDTYFGAAGLFSPQIDHAIHALEFATEVRNIVHRVGAERGVNIDLAAGIHSGEVTSYLIGKRKINFDVVGETVMIAKTLCDIASDGKGGVVISQSVYDLTQGLYEFSNGSPLNFAGRMTIPTWTYNDSKMLNGRA
jgi:class 3 adenylate cyclase